MPLQRLAPGCQVFRAGSHIAGTPDRGLKADHDLASLPSPYLTGTPKTTTNLRWETQRCCPFKCAFCQHREPGNRLKIRWLNETRILDEANLFANRNVQRISILDPIFHANPKRAVSLLNDFKAAGLGAQLSIQCRFELVNEGFLDALDGLDVELEFGLQTTSVAEGRVIGRPNNILKAEHVIAQPHDRALSFEVSLIYGLPLQTLTSFQQSVDWCLVNREPKVPAWPLMLMRETPLESQRAEYGFVECRDERIPIVTASNTFSGEKHRKMARIATELEQSTCSGDDIAS